MTAVDISNLALSYLGDTATVASIDPPEGSAQAQHCARFYPIALGMMLEAHQWSFITKRAYLAAVVVDGYFGEWQYCYAMPSDASDIISVLPKCIYPTGYFDAAIMRSWVGDWYQPLQFELNPLKDFQIEMRGTQQVILSNAEDAVARYTCSTVQPGQFPAQFTNALARLLASMLAGPIMKGDIGAAEGKRQYAMYQLQVAQAQGQDANQRHGNYRPQAPWMVARG